MKPVYALTLCLGLLEGADAGAIPGSAPPKSGCSFSEPEVPFIQEDAGFLSKQSARLKARSDSIFPVFKLRSETNKSSLRRRAYKTDESYGSDDNSDDGSGEDSDDAPLGTPEQPVEYYEEPMMAPTYVRAGALPVDQPKVKSSKESSKPKSKDDTVKTAKHGSDDDSESGGHKQKGKDKGKGKGNDNSTESRSKTEDSTKTSTADPVKTTSPSGKGSGKGKGNSGKHDGSDDATKSRTRVEDSTKTRTTQAPTATLASKAKGKSTKSSKSSKDDPKKSKSTSRRSRRGVAVHQSGKTFDADSTKGGGKTTVGYSDNFPVPKLNKGYIQAIPPRERSDSKTGFKLKPKPQLRNADTSKYKPHR